MMILSLITFTLPPLPSSDAFGGGITGGLIVFILALLYLFAKNRLDARSEKEKREDEGNLARKLQEINFKELSVKQQEVVFNQSMTLLKNLGELLDAARAELKTEKELRLLEVGEERRLREQIAADLQQVIINLNNEIDRLDRRAETLNSLLVQELKHSRSMFDLRNVACWQITPDGKLYGNIVFFTLTGLEPEEAQSDGWFRAIDEGAPEENLFNRQKWRSFINDFQSRPVHKVRFKNLKRGFSTETNVFLASLLETTDKPYLFIAYTDPIPRGDTLREDYERRMQSRLDG